MSAIRTNNFKAGLPTLEAARRLVVEEMKGARREGARVLQIIHGWLIGRTWSDLCRPAQVIQAAE